MENRDKVENTPLEGSFIYIVLAIAFLTLFMGVYMAIRCFPLYNLTSPLSTELQREIWGILALPSVIVPIALLLSNMLSKRLSSYSLCAVLTVCCFNAVSSKLYELFEISDVVYMIFAFELFLVSGCLTVVIGELLSGKKLCLWLNTVLTVTVTLIMLLITVRLCYTAIWDIISPSFIKLSRISLMCMYPLFCLSAVMMAFADIYLKRTRLMVAVTLGASAFPIAFGYLGNRAVFVILALLFTAALTLEMIDVVKYIFLRRYKNDSKSCNA